MFDLPQSDGATDCRIYDPYHDNKYSEDKFKLDTPDKEAGNVVKQIPFETSKRLWNSNREHWKINLDQLLLTITHLISNGYSISIEQEVIDAFEEETGVRFYLPESEYDQKAVAEAESDSDLDNIEVTDF